MHQSGGGEKITLLTSSSDNALIEMKNSPAADDGVVTDSVGLDVLRIGVIG